MFAYYCLFNIYLIEKPLYTIVFKEVSQHSTILLRQLNCIKYLFTRKWNILEKFCHLHHCLRADKFHRTTIFLTSFGIINFAYRNPLRIIRTFISQNQTFKYRCGLHTETIFKNFFSFIEVLLFLVDLQVPHRWCSSISTISFETYVQPL